MNQRYVRAASLSVLAAALLVACAQDAPPVAAPAAPADEAPAADADAVVPPAAPADDAELDRAQAAAAAFGSRLRGRLQAAMAEGGPTAAVEVCHTEAPRIAEAVMAEHGVRLGRVAVPGRNRNPVQAANDWQLSTLKIFGQRVADGEPAGEQLAVIRDHLPGGVALRMMRGIATEPGCLACHGSDVAPDVREAILANYPHDGATGFAVGDLRGALWVEVPGSDPATGGSP
ncbi:Tll0287-like domain-containing protein [Stenotrophomonas sp. JC08]|uniref:Tll0287-like domain-containing protein n=1 Tax=Stenotrophomonas sp. JC08 TaxID=3445779 RepID=UPI003FA24717